MFGALKHLKEVDASRWARSPFHLVHLALGRIHEGGLDDDLMWSLFNVEIIRRWSLPEKEPREVEAFRAMLDDGMMRSMVDDFMDDSLILVPRSFG